MSAVQMWVLLTKTGAIVPWVGARATRKEVIARAVRCCISATDYQRLTTDSARWKVARRRGYRIARAMVTAQQPTKPEGE